MNREAVRGTPSSKCRRQIFCFLMLVLLCHIFEERVEALAGHSCADNSQTITQVSVLVPDKARLWRACSINTHGLPDDSQSMIKLVSLCALLQPWPDRYAGTCADAQNV